MERPYVTASAALHCPQTRSADATKLALLPTRQIWESVMLKSDNRCSNCGGKFGLVSYHHWGLRFCRKACRDNFLAKTAKDHACMRRWFGFLPRGAACVK